MICIVLLPTINIGKGFIYRLSQHQYGQGVVKTLFTEAGQTQGLIITLIIPRCNLWER